MTSRGHRAEVKDAREFRMGSPLFGQLILDGRDFLQDVESQHLVWTDDGEYLAVQEVDSWHSSPRTRVLVIDATKRRIAAASENRDGFCWPIRFEENRLVYRHWQHEHGEEELHLELAKA